MYRAFIVALIAVIALPSGLGPQLAFAGSDPGGSCACSITCGGTFWSPLRCTAEGVCPCKCKCSGTSPVCSCGMNVKEEGGEG